MSSSTTQQGLGKYLLVVVGHADCYLLRNDFALKDWVRRNITGQPGRTDVDLRENTNLMVGRCHLARKEDAESAYG
jgi:hypothetical protein